jgi:hypothetical protein
MHSRAGVISIVLGLLFLVVGSSPGRADPAAVATKIANLNESALALYKGGDIDKAKAKLLEAVALGKKNDMPTHPAMARTYLNLGAVYLDGLNDQEHAHRYFALALKIQPDIQPVGDSASKNVQTAFDKARKDSGGTAAPARAEARAETKAEAPAAARSEPKSDSQAGEKLGKQLAEAKTKLDMERMEREKLLADAKADYEKQLKEKDKALAEATSKLEAEKKERDKLLAEATAKLDKEKKERDKLLAEAEARVGKEREAREKLEKEKVVSETREKERKSQEEKQKLERARLEEGPDFPAQVPQAIFCPVGDESASGADLYVHCATQPSVKAKAVLLYYRPSGVLHFNSVNMEHSKKGWWTSLIPAGKVKGKFVQYYVEARDSRGDLSASQGKATSPNIISLRPASATASAAH